MPWQFQVCWALVTSSLDESLEDCLYYKCCKRTDHDQITFKGSLTCWLDSGQLILSFLSIFS